MRLAIGNDHSALAIKAEVVEHLRDRGVELVDVGTNSEESFDYAISGYRVGRLVADGEVDGGVLICGTGVGISIAANKVNGIRACCCSDVFSAKYTRMHNDANALCLGGRVIGPGLAAELVDLFLDTPFEGGRHQKRVDKLMKLETE